MNLLWIIRTQEYWQILKIIDNTGYHLIMIADSNLTFQFENIDSAKLSTYMVVMTPFSWAIVIKDEWNFPKHRKE